MAEKITKHNYHIKRATEYVYEALVLIKSIQEDEHYKNLERVQSAKYWAEQAVARLANAEKIAEQAVKDAEKADRQYAKTGGRRP